jgi:hypothetical protein
MSRRVEPQTKALLKYDKKGYTSARAYNSKSQCLWLGILDTISIHGQFIYPFLDYKYILLLRPEKEKRLIESYKSGRA